MLKRIKFRGLRAALVFGLLLLAMPVAPAQASLNTCSVEYSPASVASGHESFYSFNIFNSSNYSLNWVQISPPEGSDISATDGAATHYTSDVQDGVITFTGGPLLANSNQVFSVKALAGSEERDMGNWVVWLSDTNDFGMQCTGNMDVTVVHPQNSITISGVGVTSINSTSATVTWNTDAPATSRVAYGLGSGYGSTSSLNSALTLSHSVTLTGLLPNTGYHFAVTSGTGQSGDDVTSSDSTFLTASVPVVSSGGTVSDGGAKLPVARGTIATLAEPAEAVPPAVKIDTNLAKPFTKDPVIAGTATDNVAVAKVEYSLDGGKNWIVVPSPPGLGTKSVNYSFALPNLEDGNYGLVVRATDTSANAAATAMATLVVDREPPRIGAVVVSFGPQAAGLDKAGRWEAAVGTDQTIGMNAVGGPTAITVEATRFGVRVPQNFYLRQDPDSGLWKGFLAYARPGLYHLAAVAVDGAGNQTTRNLPDMVVAPAATVKEAGSGRPVANGTVTVYYRQLVSGKWLVWDGDVYGETNPQKTTKNGNFTALVPAGTYYMKIEAPGHMTMVTKAFTVDKPTPLVPELVLSQRAQLHLWGWTWTLPGLTLVQTSIDPAAPVLAEAAGQKLVGHSLPNFSLPVTGGDAVTPVKLQGKPTIVTVLATWAPAADEQLPALEALAKARPDVNVRLLYMGERAGKVQAALARAGYGLTAIIDAHATLGAALGAANVPMHYFIDREGSVKVVKTGVLQSGDLEAQVAGL